MSDDNFSKVLLPMIRRMVPTIIANDIVGVQPMNTVPTVPYELQCSEILNELQETVYCVQVIKYIISIDMPNNMREWVYDTFGDRVSHAGNKFYFERDSDRTLFLLKWAV